MEDRLLIQELVGKSVGIRPLDRQPLQRPQLSIKAGNDIIGCTVSFDVVQHLQDIVGTTLRVIFRIIYTTIPAIRRLITNTWRSGLHISIEIIIRFGLQQP